MTTSDDLKIIFAKLADKTATNEDLELLRQAYESSQRISFQYGESVINIGEGKRIQIGDQIYHDINIERIREIVLSILNEQQSSTQIYLPSAILESQVLKVSPKGREKARKEMINKALSEVHLAEKIKIDISTVLDFFNFELVEKNIFTQICEQLNLPWQNIVDDIDVIVKELRENIYSYIQEICGKMRVLDMEHPIGLSAIYTSVNILQKILGRRRLGIRELLQGCNLQEFDRFGLTDIKEKRVPGLEAVKIYKKIIILGKPGAGKTTFLKYLAIQCNEGVFQPDKVPIFITLKDFAESKYSPTLLEYINQQLAEYQADNLQIANKILERGRGLILLDGLDEVRESEHDRVLREIRQFSVRFSECQFIMTCRIAAREYTFEQFTEVEVADFDDQQIHDFVDKWFQIKKDIVKVGKFTQRVKENEPIRELATNPLLLTLLCLVFEDSGDFPPNRSELYKEGLDVLLKKWDAKRNIERDHVYKRLSLKRKQDLLSQIAFSTFTRSEYFFKQKFLEEQITDYIRNLPDASTDSEVLQLDCEAVLKSIEAQHGLLVERARGIYSFSHLTFQEYFTAQKIITSSNPNAQEQALHYLVTHVSEKRWREVFLLSVGMLNNAEYLLTLMKENIDTLLVKEHNLQNFLNWVHQKSQSTQLPYKLNSVRAFYFAIAYTVSLNMNKIRDIKAARDQILSCTHDLTNAIARDFIQTLARAISNALDNAQQISLSLDLDLCFILDPNLTQNALLPRDIALAFDSELQYELKELRDELHIDSEYSSKQLVQWWHDKGRDVVARLNRIILPFVNSVIDWQFNQEQQKQLKEYYEANKLLVNCLNSDCYISREIRENIEITLLLPIVKYQ
ncbi:NACHT domain-containing NTPase [Nostoc sp. FACHB-87]|uniref:NACHT C-terminal helical domain 2-containing protein n=1 Tax=Nostocaceae TaxID=1162 RepID=UPI001685C5A5|nr:MULTISPECIES: NACHT domain-containing protein [Nostocaceae]MBD2455265.1 NACHT domain-containing NTPase [Nostoc sp. FACHB-87]MBD2476910.1 NACHT domain-containing NTPase [Anabaena sp. FACHB-83]